MNELIRTIVEQSNPGYLKNYDNFTPGDFVQYSGQLWDQDELTSAVESFLSGKWVVAGEKVSQFQNKFSKRFNVSHSLMVNSGSSANLVLITALRKHLQWNDGDEIIVSPVGFPTTVAPIVQNNLKPVFIDIELDTLNFDVDKIWSKITPKTKAIFVSPVLGNPPDIDKLVEICELYGIILIGDNCDSLGTLWKDELITNFYYAWTTSFYPAHHISTGEGGMVCSDDKDLIRIATSIAWWGRDCYCIGSNNLLACGTCGNRFDKWLDEYDGVIDHKYVFTNIGYNLKPLDLQGAIGIAQLKKFDMLESRRREYKESIQKFIEDNIDGVRVINSTQGSNPSWFGVPIYCETKELRESLVAYFEKNKIQTRSYFAGNLLIHPAYKHLDDYNLYPNSNFALSNVFFLGCSPLYNENVLQYIREICESWKK